MSDLNQIKCLVVDNGGFTYLAERLARDFGKVSYSRPLGEEFPKAYQMLIGKGMDDVELLAWQEAEKQLADQKFDLVVFPDVHSYGIQYRLRKQGVPVWGMGEAEHIETDRWLLGDVMEQCDLARNERELIKGVEDLGRYLRGVKNRYVKVNRYRGDMESYHHENWFTTEPWFNELKNNLGVVGSEFEFVVEEPIDGIEVGFDGWCIDGKFPDPCLWGFEVKDLGYIGRVTPYSMLPKSCIEVNEKLSKYFTENNSRGSYSTEVRVGKDKVAYLIDPCCRCGSPPTQLICEMFDNLGEIMYEGANGNIVTPKHEAKYGCVAIIESNADNPQIDIPIQFPKEWSQFIKFRDCYYDAKGRAHVLPQPLPVPQIGAVVGLGDSVSEAFAHAKEVADSITGYSVSVKVDSFNKAEKVIEDAAKIGIKFED